MYAAATSVALVGGDVRPVEVQVHIGRAQEAFKLSGLPDTALREAKDRVRSAIHSTGVKFPNRTVTVNLAPAGLQKAGTDFDLPIALGILAANRDIPDLARVISVGELALDGRVKGGAAAIGGAVLSARSDAPCLAPQAEAAAAASVPGSSVFGVASLAQAVEMLHHGLDGEATPSGASFPAEDDAEDLSDVRGQPIPARAVEIAAAGGHHLLFHGPPGGGKTMLARRLRGLLPYLDESEAVEVALVYAAASLRRGIDVRRPFRAPHHTASRPALVGGGSGVAVPGEVSLAHRGVLFLDELAEFPRSNLDTLRQPLEDGSVTVARRGTTSTFPSRFQLVAATNPCPCGFRGDRRRPCECRPSAVSRYRLRVSGPLMDRFDLIVKVDRPQVTDGFHPAEPTASVRGRVQGAQATLRAGVSFGGKASAVVSRALEAGLLTARGAGRVRDVSTTIAALFELDRVGVEHVEEAMALRVDW